MELLNWATKNAATSGALAEQLNPYSGEPISARPLLWSHAGFVTAVCEYINKYQENNNQHLNLRLVVKLCL
jgi:GH15 family glucan-1,4-alpha-glucosidase